MALQPFTEEQLNYFKFAQIALDEFPKALRQTFVKMWDNTLGHLPGHQVWDDSPVVRNLLLAAEGGATGIPTNTSINDWDCSALFRATIFARSFALPDSAGHPKTLSDLYVRTRGLDRDTLQPSVISPGGNVAETFTLAIDQLRRLRNKLCHSAPPKIDKTTFDQWMQRVKEAFSALGVNTAFIDAIGSLTESDFPVPRVKQLEENIRAGSIALINFFEEEVKDEMHAMRMENIESGRERQEQLRESREEVRRSFEAVYELLNNLTALVKVHIDCETIATVSPQSADTELTQEAHHAGSQRALTTEPHLPGTGSSQGTNASVNVDVGNQTYSASVNVNVSSQPHPSTVEILNLIAQKFLVDGRPLSEFTEYMEQVRKVLIMKTEKGSLVVTVECGSLEILEGLWADYTSGHLNEVAQELLITPEILKELGLTSVKLKVTILKEEYEVCKQYFLQSGIPQQESKEENTTTADSYHNQGKTQYALGDYTSALESHKRALGIRRKLLCEQHLATANNL